MSTIHIGRFLVTACLTTAIIMPAPAARAASVVVPNAWETVEGSTFLGSPLHLEPFGGQDTARYQQVYAADQFAGRPGPMMIEALVFRPDAAVGFAYGPTTYEDITVRLSTTAVGPGNLSILFASNVGPDETLVFSGDLTSSCSAVTLPDGTREFDIVVALDTPFLYDPDAGNLLLDFVNPHNTSETFWDYETSSGGAVGSLLGYAESTTANWVSQQGGFITRIDFTPACPPDVDGSGTVDFTDLLAVLFAWGPCAACPADVDANGNVDFQDLLAVLVAWGPCA